MAQKTGGASRLALIVAATLGALPCSALAQSTTVPDEGAAGVEDTIFVTARRRGESLQDVPVAVTALQGEQLEALGTPDITYVAQTVPNTTLEVSRGTNTTLTAFIRGVGQQDPVAGFEAGVGIYVDDVYLNRPQGAVLDIYDVERIEVLRGPQGTLYGRNTIGGAVKYVTRRLGSEPALELRGTYGTFNQADLVAKAEAPLTDTLRVGAAFGTFNRDGFGKNLTTGEENYDKEILSARGTVEFEPSDVLFLRATADWLKDTSSPRGGHRPIVGLVSGAPVLDDVYDTRGGIEGPNETEAWGISLSAELELTDALSLKSITAWRDDETETQIDFDALPQVDVDVPAIYNNDQFTQEVQLTYEGDAVQGVAGVYYIDANAYDTFDVVLGTTGLALGLPGLNANTTGDVDTKSWAVFGDFSFDLERMMGWQGFELSLGGRYTEDKRSADVLRRTFIGGRTEPLGGMNPTLIATTSDFQGAETFDDFSPRVSLSYAPNGDNDLYVSYSQGFKGGGFDPRGQSTDAIDFDGDGDVDDADIFDFFLFEPEEVDSYEAGWKSQAMDGRLTNNVAVFFADYKNVQIPGSAGGTDPVTGAPTFVGITTNAGAAEFFGVELEGTAVFSEDLTGAGDRLSASYSLGYIDADYTEFVVAGEDVADERVVQNTPKWSGALQTNYTRPVGAGELSFLTVTSFKDSTNQFEVPNSLIDQPSYFLFDASLVWTEESGRWQVGLHGKNLFDRQYRVSGYNFLSQNADGSFVQPITATLGLDGVATTFYGAPRQVFATVTARF
ncbi:TonB-dependent receptor [Parvularcula dongshanensis]|uniref:Iron complex outermembrane receptor protein n=1 Tax=Parvularcula dongshanensis TaxID=1173995 RepID=A0A840I6H9_9PROT|nr:TonB-dependent receptor [Parvularcula dongshanensis]MBB4659610.1 iron complex outermembrane receptor protein [Parvularcula dongshanensis]